MILIDTAVLTLWLLKIEIPLTTTEHSSDFDACTIQDYNRVHLKEAGYKI